MRGRVILTSGNVLSRLLQFVLPFLFSYFMQMLYGAVDMWAVGKFGSPGDIASINIGSQVIQILMSVIVGTAVGTTVKIGNGVGAEDKKACSEAFGNTVWIFVIIAAAFTVFLTLTAGNLAAALQTPAEAVDGAAVYMRICGIGIPFIVAYNVVSAILRGDGNSFMPMVFVFVACIINITGDIILTAVMHMGVMGVAVATVSAQAVASVIGMLYIFRKGLSFPITKEGFRLNKKTIGSIVAIGIPMAVQDVLTSVSFIAISVLANLRGVADASAVGVVEKIISIMFLFPMAMMSSISAFTAQNIGAGKPERGAQALKYGVVLASVFGLAFAIAVQFVPEPLVSIFTDDPSYLASACQYLKSYAFDCFAAGFVFSINGYLTGIGKPMIVFIHSSIVAIGVRIPLAALFSTNFPDTLFPMGLAAPISSCVSVVICSLYLLYRRKHSTL